MSNLDHIILYCLLYSLAIWYDRLYHLSLTCKNLYIKQSYPYPIIAILLSIIFLITEGLRYGRGVDQIGNYGPFYLHCMSPNLWVQDMEQMFIWLNQIVLSFDFTINTFPFGLIFIVYAAIFWICLWYLYKDYKSRTKYFLLFAILATNYITEWTIRQGVSFSFILLALHYLLNNNKKWFFFYSLIAFGIHHGNILIIFVLLGCFILLNKKPFSWKITVPLFILLECTMQISIFIDVIQKFLNLFDLSILGGNFQNYINNNAFENEAEISMEWKRGWITQFITVFFYSSLLILGNYACKIYKDNTFIYNAFVIGIIIFEPFRLAGTVSRLFICLSILWFIPLSLSFNCKNIFKDYLVTKIAKCIVIIYLILYWGRYVFMNPQANYIWNL